MTLRASPFLVLLPLVVVIAACGGQSTVNANANASSSNSVTGTRSADAANVAQQVTEPRTGDPTAARSSSTTPITTGVSAPLTSGAGGVGSAKTDPAATNNDDIPKPLASASTKNEADLPKKISARHVLIQWMGADKAAPSIVRSREQALAVAKQVLKRAKAGDDFARLAIEFSDEPGAGGRGGSLGRFGRGQMVPAFDQVAFRLDVNQVSDIVETQFGFHVIQRTE